MTKKRNLLLLSFIIASCSSTAIRFNYATLPDPRTQPYRLQAGDVLFLRILRNDGASSRLMVTPEGTISLPLGGQLSVTGQTLPQVRQQVVERITRYFQDAAEIVSVSLEETRGIRYSVIGEAQRAGAFEAREHVTLLEALANAGGLTPYAKGNEIYVLRQNTHGTHEKIPVSYDQTVKDPSSNRNFFVLTGDVIVVP